MQRLPVSGTSGARNPGRLMPFPRLFTRARSVLSACASAPARGAAAANLVKIAPKGKLGTMKTLTAIIFRGETGRWLVAYNPETGTTTQGKTVEQALQNLKEAVALYLEEEPVPAFSGAILTTFEVAHG